MQHFQRSQIRRSGQFHLGRGRCGETGHEAACAIGEAIRAHIESLNIPNPRSATSPWVTASLGVSTIVPTQLDDIKEFFVSADRAMYAVKEAGRNGMRAVETGATLALIQAALHSQS